MDKLTYFEFTSPDTAAEMKFFSDVFGWEFQKYGDQDYWLATTTGPDDGQGINGAIMAPPMEGAPRVTNTLNVDDIDAAIAAATAAGATIAVPKAEVPGYGTLAYLVSPTGIVFGVIQLSGGSM